MNVPNHRFRRRTFVIGAQTLLGASAAVLAFLPGLPWVILLLLGLVVLCGPATSLHAWRREGADEAQARPEVGWLKGLAWGATLGYCAGAAWMWELVEFWDPYYAVIAWLVAGSLAAGHGLERTALRPEWLKGVAWVWAMMGAWIWVGAAYLLDRPLAFHAGLALWLGLFILLRLWFRLSAFGIQASNSVMLLLIALPLVDRLMITAGSRPSAAPADRPYSFLVARQDPARFASWWMHYQDAWDRMALDIFMPDPNGQLPLRLRPNSQGYLIESLITINRDGFRGREFAADKGDAYRILALGESTTFGCTLEANDRPWPELLEELIRSRLLPDRPVEVINAGVPAYSLTDNLSRFERELLPLEPDMIISYHGYNGFPLLRPTVRPPSGILPPMYTKRPSTLLARIEFRLESFWHDRRTPVDPRPAGAPIEALLETDYAVRYRELIGLADARGIRLVLCTFSMAVDRRSAREVVEFYRPGFPAVHWHIKANEAHSTIVRQLARAHPDVWLVETGRGLDGQHELYIDLVHLTQTGRRQLASNLFDALVERLAVELTAP